MTPSLPFLASVTLATGLLRPLPVPVDPVADVVEHVAAPVSGTYWTPQRMARALPIDLLSTAKRVGSLTTGVLPAAPPKSAPLTGTPLNGALKGTPLNGALKGTPLNGTPLGGALKGAPLNDAALQGTPLSGALKGAPLKNAAPLNGTPLSGRVVRQAAAPAALPATSTSGSHWPAGGAVTRTTGRVFLTMNGVDFVCSASAIHSANKDVVITAGHCVKDGAGMWAQNWMFVPGYDEGRQPYGAYTARRMFVTGPWSRRGDDDYDVGMVAVTTAEGRHLTDAVGGQEIGFDPRRGQRTFGFGFPADPPYDGEQLLYCAGLPHGDPQGQTRDQGLRCDLTAGASGGPWLTGFDPATGRGLLTSVSSFKYSNDHGTMYGPYFGPAVRDLYRVAEYS